MYLCYCDQKSIPKKKQLDLLDFQSSIAEALLLANKEIATPKRGRPSTSATPEVIATKKTKRSDESFASG